MVGSRVFGAGCAAVLVSALGALTGCATETETKPEGSTAQTIQAASVSLAAYDANGVQVAEGSGIIATAIVGGAIIPPLTGMLADSSGSLHFALLLPALCYGVILAYGIFARRPAPEVLAVA